MVIYPAVPPLPALIALFFAFLLTSAPQFQATAGKPPPQPRRQPRHSLAPPLPCLSPPPSPAAPISPSRSQLSRFPAPPLPSYHQGITADPKRKSRRMNLGKKVGLSFAGIALIMQFAVVGFLAYKKRQLLKVLA